MSRNTIIPAGPDTVSSPDNGAGSVSTLHAIACHQLGLRHLRTRPRRPRTNGKAERFIRTLLAGWAYAAIYANSQERADALDAGSTPTITPDHTAASATNHPFGGYRP
jgi:transposase InsO family protein